MSALLYGAEGYASIGGPAVRITLKAKTMSAAEAEAFAHVILAQVAEANALSEPRERSEDDYGQSFDEYREERAS